MPMESLGGALWRCKSICHGRAAAGFLTETNESIDVADVELVRFEQEPNNAQNSRPTSSASFTPSKGTCGFLNLPRLEALTHAAEALIGQFPRRRAGHWPSRSA